MRRIAERLRFETARDLFLGFFHRHAVEEARVDHAARPIIRGIGDDEFLRIDTRRADDRNVAEPVFVGKIQVALVVRRAAEDRAGAVFHQHEIGDKDRQLPIRIEGMQRAKPGVVAAFLAHFDRRFRRAAPLAIGDELGKRGVMLSEFACQRMLGRNRHEFRAKQRVRARRVDIDLASLATLAFFLKREAHKQAFGAADPVRLHEPHFFWPAVERLQRREQIVGVFGYGEEPLRQLALLDRRTGTPAASIDHLLVGKHGLIDRIPVDARLLARDEARGEKIQE